MKVMPMSKRLILLSKIDEIERILTFPLPDDLREILLKRLKALRDSLDNSIT